MTSNKRLTGPIPDATREWSPDDSGERGEPMPQCFLAFGQRIYPLKEGVNVIGRDAAVEVSVDSPALSRRHACIVVGAEGATIEDLGSKNGTFVRGKRIDMPAEISDSDSLQLGSLWMVFRAPAAGEE